MLLKRETTTVDGALIERWEVRTMVTWESITAISTVGLLIVAIVDLLKSRKK